MNSPPEAWIRLETEAILTICACDRRPRSRFCASNLTGTSIAHVGVAGGTLMRASSKRTTASSAMTRSLGTTKQPPKDDVAATYNEFKEFEGRRDTGMRVGRSHKWNYDSGVWAETKVTPDQWQINYAVTKRRVGKAPEGSGVPVGTAYHWYILAHQYVTKLNANDYSTSLTGMKFKLAHLRAGTGTWSASTQAQRRQLIKILRQVLHDLEREDAASAKKPAVGKLAAPARK